MNVNIRQADAKDLGTVQQFGYLLLKYEHDKWDSALELDWPFSEQGKAAYLMTIENGYTLLAEVDGKPVGFLIGSIKYPKPGSARQIITAQLENIFVDEEMRGCGVGEKLALEFKEHCLSEKVNKLNVTVNSENAAAIRFYEKVGFVPSRMILTQELQ